jgi:rhodanese-related sulfurtransferase
MYLSPETLHNWKLEGKPFQLIDIREPYEIEQCTIGGQVIPMELLVDSISKLNTDTPVVLHCNSGKRSEAACFKLRTLTNREDIFSLAGGIQGYAQQFEPQLDCIG